MANPYTTKISAAGATVPAVVNALNVRPSGLLPGFMTAVSPGATLTYTIQVTADDINAPGYSAANGNWFPFDATSTGISVGYNGTIKVPLTAVRALVTSYTSGTLTLQMAQ